MRFEQQHMSHVVPSSMRFDIEHEHDRRENILSLGWPLYWHNGAKLCVIDLNAYCG